uniref:Putative cation efflux system protein SilA n=1 Tax=Stylophora pistillata TaxID=50429 RepID=A0A2B4RE11_STYPI
MLYKIIRFLIENKFIAFLLGLLIIGAGYITAPFDWGGDILPRNPVAVDAIPDIGENQQIVFTKWAGQSPQEIQDQITYPLTTSLMGIAGVKTIRSTTMFGFSSIYLIFEEGVDFYWSRTRILEKLNSLPPNLLPKGVRPSLGADATGIEQIFWYTIEGRDENGHTTGGWDLEELRSIQDYFVKYNLSSSKGVAEVASIGGMVKSYQIALDPEKLKYHKIPLEKVVAAAAKTNQNSGGKTMEINKVEYIIRGLGYVKNIRDLENTVVAYHNKTPILISDVARVYTAPKERRGILDKEGSEVVGGVVTARYGANPMQVIKNIKAKIEEINTGLPSKKLTDGRVSKLKIIPFYDRSKLIDETIDTLSDALFLEILITVLVIMLMIADFRIAGLISGLLPLTILMVFVAMKYLGVSANIVALSGIAISIGTIVDVGIVLSESILRKFKKQPKRPINQTVYKATKEVSGAIITAVMTTIVSFIPVFAMGGSEGKLFIPLAATKTMALVMAIVVALFILPPLAAFLLELRKPSYRSKIIRQIVLVLLSTALVFWHPIIGLAGVLYGLAGVLYSFDKVSKKHHQKAQLLIIVTAILILLSKHWMPLGFGFSTLSNFIFSGVICSVILWVFYVFQKYYTRILWWALANKKIFLMLPLLLVLSGIWIWRGTDKEFMPTLNEGSFLLMPTSLPHAGVAENKRVLQALDIAVMQIPEVKTVVGKAGRTESALDPAPLSMYENIIHYFPEYKTDENGKPLKFKTDENGLFLTKSMGKIKAGTRVEKTQLIPDAKGAYYRNWRAHIKSPDDIWEEIARVTKMPGVTSAPKLQPIETRLVMLQTGMRSPMGIKIKGVDLKKMEAFGKDLEAILKEVEGVKKTTVFADKIVGKPYISVKINREKLVQYGVQIAAVQNTIKTAIGGKVAGQTIEGEKRYDIEIRYPRELRNDPEKILDAYVPLPDGNVIPLRELASVHYEKGAQAIKSEDHFLIEKINLSVAVWVGFIALFGIATDDGVLMATQLKKAFQKTRGNTALDIRKKIVKAASLMLVSCKGKKKSEPATKIEDTAVQTASFGVRGNCGMCKETIEKAALGIAGVASAVWDKTAKQIEVKFTGDVLDDIHTAIANSGYDTEKKTANDEAYNSRPKCCQYDRNMQMSVKKEAHKEEDHKQEHDGKESEK